MPYIACVCQVIKPHPRMFGTFRGHFGPFQQDCLHPALFCSTVHARHKYTHNIVTCLLCTQEHVFEFTMVQRVGGWADGYWFTHSLIADGNEWCFMKKHPGMVA